MAGDAHETSPATVAAFFDVDNTVIRGGAAFHVVRIFKRHGFFSNRDLLRFGWSQVKYLLFGEAAVPMDELREEAMSFVKGRSTAEIQAVAEQVYDEFLALRVYPGTKAIIDEHLAQGHEVWFVTASPVEVGSLVAHRLGATGALGTVAEHIDGFYTGRLDGEFLHKGVKAVAVRALAEERGIDLAASSAYGDSHNDIPMLSVVGHACAINPDTALRRHAVESGWGIEEFRRRRKNGRRGIVRSTVTGGVWATLVVARGVKALLCAPFKALRSGSRRAKGDDATQV
ncbi:HAD family phosphatase [Demequina sp. NBRC 110057]|uniref:HAD family hydrolase n=1 Tax=Demequina sp. NBRC 110057 TaxID=1570346 RepID=UPI000A077444|nr:HAD-IB family hydrolase [Demequina sp. NBRC 110057]